MSKERKHEFSPLVGEYEFSACLGCIFLPEQWRDNLKDANWMVYEYWGKILMKLGPVSVMDAIENEYRCEKVRIIERGRISMDENGRILLPGSIETNSNEKTVRAVGMLNHVEIWA